VIKKETKQAFRLYRLYKHMLLKGNAAFFANEKNGYQYWLFEL